MSLAAVAFVLAAMTSAQAPVEIDRTLQRVYGTAIMKSDVRQARLLKLVSSAAEDDEAVQTAVENRLLMLHEATRGTLVEPTPAQIAARREKWTAGWPPGTDVPKLLQRGGMNDRSLDGWFRDDIRIEMYLEQRFSPTDTRRDERIAAWIKDLRHRANLK